MRTAFGKFSEELRVKRKMTQSEFSEKTGMSLPRISNIESQRSNIGEDVVRCYLHVLQCTGEEAHNLRKLALFSDGLRKRSKDEATHPPLQVMLEQFGDRISPQSAAKIQQILELETGESVETLRFSSNMTRSKSHKGRGAKRPSILLSRMAEIAIQALELRRTICRDSDKLDVGYALQIFATQEERFDFRILKQLPSHLDGAFACIYGHSEGHTILIEEKRFRSALNGVHFARHVICHEIGHHFLHANLLSSDNHMFLAPQEIAKNSCEMIGSPRQIKQIVDSIVEVEAECFAIFLLVPWEVFIKGTSNEYISSDFGEQIYEVRRFAKYFKNDALLDAFRKWLWNHGQRRHPIFDLN